MSSPHEEKMKIRAELIKDGQILGATSIGIHAANLLNTRLKSKPLGNAIMASSFAVVGCLANQLHKGYNIDSIAKQRSRTIPIMK
jgi:uncharacterized membrane protein YebE (DUF533 family)